MTIEEKRKAIKEYCDQRVGCIGCPLDVAGRGNCYSADNDPDVDADVEHNYTLLFSTTDSTVNHPSHYNRDGGMECIDEMLLVFGREAVMHFCLCNAWKYRYRASDKNGAEDLRKADWYLAKYKELLGGDET